MPNEETSLDPAIRICGFVILSSFDIRASSFSTAHRDSQSSSSLSFHRNWFSGFIDSDVSKNAMCNADLLSMHVTAHPNFHRDNH